MFLTFAATLAVSNALSMDKYILIEYRSAPKKGAWQAMVEAVETNAIDWAVGGISVSLKRGTFTDFTRYIKNQGFAISYAVYQNPWTTFENILLVFEWPIWLTIAFLIVLIYNISKWVNRALGFSRNVTVYTRLTLSCIVEQPASGRQMTLLKVPTLRILFFVWWLTCLNITSMYKSQLTSTLIQPNYNEPQRIDDLVTKDFRFLANKEEWSVLKENLESSSDEIFEKVLIRIDDHLDFCESILALKGQTLAVIGEEIAMQYDVLTSCKSVTSHYRSKLRLVKENIFPNTYHAWSMPMGTPFRSTFSKTIGRMDDYGLIDYWHKLAAFLCIPRSNSRTEGSEATALTLVQFLPSFMVLVMGWVAAFVIFLVEIYVKQHR